MNDKRRIGIVVSTLGLGGNERSAINIFYSLKTFYKTFLITFDGSDYKKTELSPNDFIDLKTPASKNYFVKAIHTIVRIKKIKRLIKKLKLDLVFLITDENTMLSRIKMKGTVKVISCRDFGHLKSNKNRFKKNLDNSDFLIFNSEYMRNYYLSFFSEDNDKTQFIHNILNLDLVGRLSNESLSDAEKVFFDSHTVICSVGRFCKEKGFNHLLRSFELAKKEKNDLGLCIVGDGPLMGDVKEMLKKSSFGKDILLVGFNNNPFKYEKASKIYVCSSISEGFPNVIIEAMSLGIPIIAANCKSGPSEILNPSDSSISFDEGYLKCDYGMLSPSFDESTDYTYDFFCPKEVLLSKAILELLSNKDLYDQYRKKSLYGIERFSNNNIVLKYERTFNKLFK